MSDTAYDPLATDEAGPRGTAYVSRKDVKIVGAALVVLGLLMWPIFNVLVRRSEKARCISNMKGIMDSINQYAIQNDDKFPPIFDTGPNDEPTLQSSGAPYTWASDLQDYMNKRVSFRCPSTQLDELSFSQDSHSATGKFPLSYGMFAPMSSFNRSLVEDPDEAVLVGETTNMGAHNTYDPLPFLNSKGDKLPYDGMAIGWDDDNFDGTKKTKYVTRMAFPDSAGAKFVKDGEGRHDEGTFVLTVTGHLRTIKPDAAGVIRRYGSLYGTWPMPLTAKRHQ
jgi:hypothetical protein